MIRKRIVAEISKDWTQAQVDQYGGESSDLLSGRFERVIDINAERGYELESWRMTSVRMGRFGVLDNPSEESQCNETIIAVFVEESRAAQATDPDESGVFQVVITSLGGEKIKVIEIVRDVTGQGLLAVKELVEQKMPIGLLYACKGDADKLKKRLEDVGAEVELKHE